jgi:P-type Cu2+ transporter
VYWSGGNVRPENILVAIEKKSEHPLAEAVVRYFKGVAGPVVSDFQSITGAGAKARVDGAWYFIGNAALMRDNKISVSPGVISKADEWLSQANTVVYFANDKEVLGIVAIADKIKTSSKEAVRQLQEAGIKVYMLTGDNAVTARAVAGQAGILHYKAEVLPAQKAEFVRKLQQEGKIVAMVGDGINDSSALAQADVSIAMGRGSDIAMNVAKMTIISSDLAKIPKAIRLSKHTVATIRQNLFWAFIYNVIGIPIAAGLLYPFTGFLLNPMIAGAAMALSSVSVVTNSLRLKWIKL